MSDNQEPAVERSDADRATDHEDDRGIEITTGEPNTFEPEEDPDAAAGRD